MRRLGLAGLVVVALACDGPPTQQGTEAVEQGEPEAAPESAVPDPSVAAEAAAEGEPPAVLDPLLARARAALRGGRVDASLRRELAASGDPHHRHAARLLQAIAGETPAPVLPRTGPRRAAAVPVTARPKPPELAEARPAPAPQLPAPVPAAAPAPGVEVPPSKPGPQAPPAPAPPGPAAPAADDARIEAPPEPPPDPASLPEGSAVRSWFWGVEVDAEATEPGPGDPDPPRAAFDPVRLFGPELTLLAERPPFTPGSANPPGPRSGPRGVELPRLIILTRLSLVKTDAGPALELAGAGSVPVEVQPLDSGRLRLRVVEAGAVPAFLQARPRGAGFEVLEVGRHEGVVEVEVALSAGWELAGVDALANGARVRFAPAATALHSER